MLEAIKYSRGHLQLLEQRGLPTELKYIDIKGPKECWTAIRDMTVRGAPAIAIAAALSLAVELATTDPAEFDGPTAAAHYIREQLQYLATSRPTAVNLFDAVAKLEKLTNNSLQQPAVTAGVIINKVIEAAEKMLEDDVKANKDMGAAGADILKVAVLKRRNKSSSRLKVLTHCNTGSLATAGFGTALGVIRTLHGRGELEHVYATETRPYNQGARLTAFELAHDGIPATLICDSAAAAVMYKGLVDAVVVGADRIAANGDTANKIGTYSLAVLAKQHNIPFFIAAPTTTIDPSLARGAQIIIEGRDEQEITHFKGQRVAAEGVSVSNPAFDITPASYIEGIITEKGVIDRTDGRVNIRTWLASIGHPLEDGLNHDVLSDGFEALNLHTVITYALSRPELSALIGPPETADSWKVEEVGDGNINFVYIVNGPTGSVCIKQALPYVRCIGEEWPLTQERIRIEYDALVEESKHCPEHVPLPYLFDATKSLMAMQYLGPPHVVLRRGLIAGNMYPNLAQQIAVLLAKTLFHSSLFAMSSEDHKAKVTRFMNPGMCQLTEQVGFTDPYNPKAQYNRHTSPQLDDIVNDIQADAHVKSAASRLKGLFNERAQALIHGDLHTGSLMVTQESCWAIDPEFAFYGPMAFDVGKIIANIFLMYFATDGHATVQAPREEQRQWLLLCAVDVWNSFSRLFVEYWNTYGGQGAAYPSAVFSDKESVSVAQKDFMAELWNDSIAFGGIVILRRLISVAHVAEYEEIANPDVRAVCERRALKLGRKFLVEGGKAFTSVEEVARFAAALREDGVHL